MAPAQDQYGTIRSTASSSYGQASLARTKQTNRVRAHVDFSEYNRNYEAYMKKHGLDLDDDRPLCVIMREQTAKARACKDNKLPKRNSTSKEQSNEDWVILSGEHSDSSK
jgi:hypothetical protein